MTGKGNPSEATSTMVFVDALEEGDARLLLGEQSFTVPRRLLPTGVQEGQWVRFEVVPAPAPDSSGVRRQHLGKDDPGGPIKL